jgi:hypothetical protein
VIDIAVPGKGARTVSLNLSLKGLTKAISVDVFDVDGKRTTQRVASPR